MRMSQLTTVQKNEALISIANSIWRSREKILEANIQDVLVAQHQKTNMHYTESFLKRLVLNENKIESIIQMMKSVSTLEDPIGKTDYALELDRGMELYRVTCPIGVIGVIFESRPDVLPQVAALCLKSGNSVIMKGGSEASKSNLTLYSIIKEATEKTGLPQGWIQSMDTRIEVSDLLKLEDSLDLLIPRGSNNFIKYIQNNTRIPVLGHSEGVCHIYVDESANLEKSAAICHDAKVQYPAVCNAVDTLLIHTNISESFLPSVVDLYESSGVEIRGDTNVSRIMKSRVKQATSEDWGSEYLDLIVAIKIVDSLDEAIDHINTFGSHHTDAIVAEDPKAIVRFTNEIDSSSVICNASTRFSDGYRYGLGAEVGISTGKIHARGPTGLDGLTSHRYLLVGSGQVVREYTDDGKKRFTHRKISKTWKNIIDNLNRKN
jgi:glutamate-5-semialdehyde dehydrogenase